MANDRNEMFRLLWCCCWVIVVVFMISVLSSVQAQNTTQATTDPVEAQALNSILEEWEKPANTEQWNTTGDPCSGAALDDSIIIDDPDYNPFIKCDCSDDNGTTCHITALKVYAIDAVGVIPDELWSLVYLTNLRIGQNYLTGPLSPGIGNLTRMQWLDFGTNALSGPVPSELGQLTDLRSLGMGPNNFSGPLPSELGNLINLEQLTISSSGVSGEIPSTFANLQNLKRVRASDTELTGVIPEFIGNWSLLESLRMEGSSLQGPIPSSFSNLTTLEELRISGLSNSSFSLDFVTSLTSLSILVLKNNNITGSIPSSIGGLQQLTQLDLSFNNISGQIPESIFNLSSLSHLFLGDNRLTGGLPSQKSPSLANIDVSYNQLSGSLPDWISEPNLQFNFVANNFSVTSSNSRSLPGLNCLLNGFPCNTGLGLYSDFAINCGGPRIGASGEIAYESDTEASGPASYFVASNDEWAVSNVGLFASPNNLSYTFNTPRQFISLDSELYQTARLSSDSLRYYGLGLQNGNYSVLLQFAEIQFENGETWKSLGRRVFDIFIQGNRVERNFDIRREAGGESYRPVQRNYTTLVTENYLEIHLFWTGKGTCCIPRQGTYGPSISAISVTPLFQPRLISSTTNTKTTALVVGIVVPLVAIAVLSLGAYWFIQRRKRLHAAEDELLGFDSKPYTFSYAELKSATGEFDPSNKLGEGGFGVVYKGTLSDGKVVAVKQLSVSSKQGKNQFITEIATISAVQHRNLVKLYGCCIDGQNRLLVYEYLQNKSLDKILFGDSKLELSWAQRFEVCLGVARGLTYLHQESRLRIVHRDVKSSNILLDSDLIPKISDFGLAKLYDDKMTHMSTGVAGTVGYLAPEYAMRGHLTEKVDVFAFGVVAMEIVSGRSNCDTTLRTEERYLLDWAWHLYEKNQYVELVDKRLKIFDEQVVKRVIAIAFLCTQTSPIQRPTMSRVLAMLSGDVEVGTVPSKPTYLADWNSETSSFMTSDSSDVSKAGHASHHTSTSI